MLFAIASFIATFLVLLGLAWIVLALIDIIALAGVYVSAAWVLVLLSIIYGASRLASRNSIFQRPAFWVERLAFYTSLAQGVVLITFVLSAIGLLSSSNEPRDGEELLFGSVIISLWVVGVLLGIAIGGGVPGLLSRRTHLLDSIVPKIVVYSICIPLGLAVALVLPLVGEPILEPVYLDKSVLHTFAIVLVLYVPLSAVAMHTMFDPPTPPVNIDALKETEMTAILHEKLSVISAENVTQLKELATLHTGPAWKVNWSQDGRNFSVYTPKTVFHFDLVARDREPIQTKRSPADNDIMTPDGALYARVIDGQLQQIDLFDARSGSQIRRLYNSYADHLWSLRFSPDSSWLAGGNMAGELWLWEVASGTGRIAAKFKDVFIHDLDYSAKADLLALACSDKVIRLWLPEQDKLAGTLAAHRQSVKCVSFNKANGLLASGSEDRRVHLWHPQTGSSSCAVLRSHKKDVRDLQFNPTGTILATTSGDGTVKLWAVQP
jgi:hypothetical protein